MLFAVVVAGVTALMGPREVLGAGAEVVGDATAPGFDGEDCDCDVGSFFLKKENNVPCFNVLPAAPVLAAPLVLALGLPLPAGDLRLVPDMGDMVQMPRQVLPLSRTCEGWDQNV